MKVIDVLNKIANNKEINAKHRLFDIEYNDKENFNIGHKSIFYFTLKDLIKILNDDVIVESKNKLEHIFPINIIPSLGTSEKKRKQFELDSRVEQLFSEVNKIIDRVNELEDKNANSRR